MIVAWEKWSLIHQLYIDIEKNKKSFLIYSINLLTTKFFNY